jgi:hypothetical protein
LYDGAIYSGLIALTLRRTIGNQQMITYSAGTPHQVQHMAEAMILKSTTMKMVDTLNFPSSYDQEPIEVL